MPSSTWCVRVALFLIAVGCSSSGNVNRPGKGPASTTKTTLKKSTTTGDGQDQGTPDGGYTPDSVNVLKAGLANIDRSAVPGATMLDLWNGRAVFRLVRADDKYAVAEGNKVAFVTMASGKWYAFAKMAGCGTTCTLGVRSSDDQGATWSAMTQVATPPPGTTNLVDQDAYYDSDVNKWFLISQCQTPDGTWRLCSFTRDGEDPVGAFTSVAAGPIVKSGYFFQDGGICAGGGHCPGNTAQEGTPDILFKINGLYYVSFHGYDGVKGYRAVAATTDFNVGWRLDPPVGLFKDVMLGPVDSALWQPGSIGIATSSTVVDGDYIYTIAESADKNLLCQPGQTWTSALLRSKFALAPTGQWEPFSHNPVANTGPAAQPCAMNYQKMFRDQKTGFVYLTFWWFNGTGYELRYYRLEPGDGRGGALVPAVQSSAPSTTMAPPAADQVAAAAAAAAAAVPPPPQDIGHFDLAGVLAKNNGGYANCHQSLMTNNGTNRPGVAPIANVWATPCYATFGGAPDCTCPAGAHFEVVGGHYSDGCGPLAAGLAAQGLNVTDAAWDCCMVEFKCMQ